MNLGGYIQTTVFLRFPNSSPVLSRDLLLIFAKDSNYSQERKKQFLTILYNLMFCKEATVQKRTRSSDNYRVTF
jgi:hypothetical protein